MGLGITAYSDLRYLGAHAKDAGLNQGEPGSPYDHCYYEGHIDAYAYDSFPQSFRGIPILTTKTFGSGGEAFFFGGCYQVTEETRIHKFRAGSYMGYNHWRADLQRQFNPDLDPARPFYELIWFADDEGTIGELAATDLLLDFRVHADQYDPDSAYPDDYRHLYRNWMCAFELASCGGLVDFH